MLVIIMTNHIFQVEELGLLLYAMHGGLIPYEGCSKNYRQRRSKAEYLPNLKSIKHFSILIKEQLNKTLYHSFRL